MEAGGYTYVRVGEGAASTWVAGPRTALAAGDQVVVENGSFVENFRSSTLKRTFERILFAEGIEVRGRAPGPALTGLPADHPPVAHAGDGCCPSGAASSDHAASPAMPGLPPGHPPVDATDGITGEVVELLSGGGYRYVQVRAKNQTVWAATNRTEAELGDQVTIPNGLVMVNFESPTLKRTFEKIYFVDRIVKATP
jgi:hypothetical protein